MYRKIRSLDLFMSELVASCIDEQKHRGAPRINLYGCQRQLYRDGSPRPAYALHYGFYYKSQQTFHSMNGNL